MNTKKERKRGVLLTIFLIFSAFGAISSLASLHPSVLKIAYGDAMPSWAYPYTILGGLFATLIFIGIWKWKKWGIYIFVVSAIVSIIMQGIVLPNYIESLSWVNLIPTVLVTAFWFWVISRKWSDFE